MDFFIKLPLKLIMRPGSHKVAIPLPELEAQTNSFSTKNRPGCSPQLLDSDPRALFLHYRVTCKLKTSDPRGHEVRVRFDVTKVTDAASARDLDVNVSCSCPAFLYWGAQWNLHERDALEGQPRPLLAPPSERLDLRGHFIICKHCKAVFERILPAVQHNIVKILRQREVEEKKRRAPSAPGTPREQRVEKDQEQMRTRNVRDEKRKQRIDKVKQELEDAAKQRQENKVVKRDEPSTQELRVEEQEQQPEPTPMPQELVDEKVQEEQDHMEELRQKEEQKLLEEQKRKQEDEGELEEES